MVGIRYPAPLGAHGPVEVAAPSAGVGRSFWDRLDEAVRLLREAGREVHEGPLVRVPGVASGTRKERLAEFHAAFRLGSEQPHGLAVLPPWGGELAMELLDGIEWEALGAAGRWLAGWSDLSTLLLPLTTLTGLATLHGANLMDEPWELPTEFLRWSQVAALHEGDSFTQRAAPFRRSAPAVPWDEAPLEREFAYQEPTRWRLLDGSASADFGGRLIGGCLETVALLAGTPYGDVPRFVGRHAPEGLVIYLEAAESASPAVLRMLTSLRLAGWFEAANGILVGRTTAPGVEGLSQEDAVRRALGGLGVPVVMDFDAGHEPPQMVLVNGALARVRVDASGGNITQELVA